MLYLVLKAAHVIGVVLFLGNIATGVFWKAHADRSGDPRTIANTLEGIIRSDRFFTIPGVIVVLLAGVGTALVGSIPILGTGWILWSIVLFSISGSAFMFRLAPLQARLADLARTGAESGQLDQPAYHALSRQWELWGLVATVAPILALLLMILKPSLPSL